LVRDFNNVSELKQYIKNSIVEFLWEVVEDTPDNLPLFFLHNQDLKEIAATVSCTQDIAGNSAFSVAMISKI